MKFRVTIAVALMALVLPLSTLNVSAGPEGIEIQQNPDDSYSISGDFLSLDYNGDAAPTFDSFGISKSSTVPIYEPLFESIEVQNFVPAADPTLIGQKVLVSGSGITVEFHNNPMATVSIESADQSLVTLTFVEEVGAIVDVGLAQVGKGGTTGELVATGGATLEKSLNEIRLRMGDGGRCIFRATVTVDEYIGDRILDGMILGELYMMQIDQNLVSDLVRYQPVSMSPSFISTEKAVVDVSGDFPSGGMVILTLDRSMFGVAAEDVVLRVDGSDVAKADHLEEILAGGEKPSFFASQNADTLEVFVHLSHYSDHTIVLSGEATVAAFPWAAVIGATVLLTAATAYLFKRKD